LRAGEFGDLCRGIDRRSRQYAPFVTLALFAFNDNGASVVGDNAGTLRAWDANTADVLAEEFAQLADDAPPPPLPPVRCFRSVCFFVVLQTYNQLLMRNCKRRL
jgi:hypothetical protein